MIQSVVGISFRPTKNDKIQVGSPIQILHDKTNQYSSRAVAVQFEGETLGYVGEKGNERHEEVFNCLPIAAKVITISRLNPGEEFAKFKEGEITHLEVEFPMASDVKDGTPSFNEPGVLVRFDSLAHRYVYNGLELLGATTYIKKWIKEFDSEKVAQIYAQNMGCKQSEILEFWDNGGNVASHYGQTVHAALEHYEKFKKLGKTIQDKKDLPFNKALPSHPELRKIVQQFIEKFGDHEVLTEVLVTNIARGLCGTIDRLKIIDLEKKICRVQDYKVNINAVAEDGDKYLGQMAELPKNKLSKYRLQLSFYGRLLELTGWTIAGLDAFVFEDEWKHYPMEMLKLDF